MERPSLLTIAAPLALLASCAAPSGRPAGPDAELRRVEERYQADTRAYEREKQRLAAGLDLPMALPFDGKGTIIVHRLELLGGPERTYVRARFTYVNSTGRSVPIPTVYLELYDRSGEFLHGSGIELTRPLGTTFAHDNAYTGWIDVEARGLFRNRGWTWSMDLEVPRTEPSVPGLSERSLGQKGLSERG